jgi:hypothetical protein
MSVLLRIPVRLARRRQSRLPLVIVSQGRVFVSFRRASIRTSCTILLIRIQRRVWLSSWIVRRCHRTPGMNIQIYSCYRQI